MKFFCVVLILVLASTLNFAYSLGHIEIRGKVQGKNESLPFATVSLVHENIGTCTNADGYFQFFIPDYCLDDTLQIRFMGYETFYAMVRDLKTDQINQIQLKEAYQELDEITVLEKGLSADKILYKAMRKASRNFARNYYVGGYFKLEGYIDNQVMRCIEADVGINAHNINFNQRRDKILINEMRKSNDELQKLSWVHKKGNELLYYFIRGEKYIKNEMYYLLCKMPVNRFELENHFIEFLGVINQDNKKLYHIKAKDYYREESKERCLSNDSTELAIEYFINAENFAFEKIIRYFKISVGAIDSTYWAYNEIVYHEIDDRYYPAVIINKITGGKEYHYETKIDGKKVSQHNESYFIANEWIDKKKKGKEKRSQLVSPYDWMSEINMPYDPNFWQSYNKIQHSGKDSVRYENLTREMSLEEQYKVNGQHEK